MRRLPTEQLDTLAAEVREFLITSVSRSGGHFAPGLGVVELTIALHHVYDTPRDAIVWDVGHQCYPHKILTGRRPRLGTIRRRGGLSGFLKRDESEHDAFETWEVAVWDGERLVAFGWFDLGAESIQSLIGAYDPRYGRHSLGYNTLLLEVRWAQRHGRRYHYAGYVVPGDPAIDYKLRVGDVEYLDPERGWRPLPEWRPDNQPVNRLASAMNRARVGHRVVPAAFH